MSLDSNHEFGGLLAALADCEDDAARKQAEAHIWERYGTRGVAFVSDMCSFSRTTRAHGICHFLGLIEHARRIIAPEVLRHGGKLLKFEIDNSFAFFSDVDSAVHCARDLNARITETNHKRAPEDRITIAIGIDHGDLLLIEDRDFFGDPVGEIVLAGLQREVVERQHRDGRPACERAAIVSAGEDGAADA